MGDDDDALLDEAIAVVRQQQVQLQQQEAASSPLSLLQQHLEQVEQEISKVASIAGANCILVDKLAEKDQLLQQIDKGAGAAEPWRCVWCETLCFTPRCGHCRVKKAFGHGPKAVENKLKHAAGAVAT